MLRSTKILLSISCLSLVSGGAISSPEAFAGAGVVGCKSVTRWVAPGGRVEIPLECKKADGYPDPGFVRELRGTTPPTHGTILLNGRPVHRLPLPDISMPVVPETIVFAADNSGVNDTFVFGAHNDDVGALPSADATATIQVDRSGKFAPHCDDVDVQAKQGETTRIALQCSMSGLTFSLASLPKHGTITSIDSAGNAVLYKPDDGYIGNDELTYTGEKTGQISNTAKIRISVFATEPTKPVSNPPTCTNTTARITLGSYFPPFRENYDPFSPKNPHPLQLHCQGDTNSSLKYEIIQPIKWGTLQNLNPTTGTLDWHSFDFEAWEKAGAKKADAPVYQDFPDEASDEPGDQGANVKKFSRGWNDSFLYRAVDQRTGLASNTATFSVQERLFEPCKTYILGEIQIGGKKQPASSILKCQKKDQTWETVGPKNAEDNSPFTLSKVSSESCVNLQASPSLREQSGWYKVTAESKIQLGTPGVIARTDKQKARFVVKVKGKKEIFPKGPGGPVKKATRIVDIRIDGSSIFNHGTESNRLPLQVSLSPSLLKPGRHQLVFAVKTVSPSKGDQTEDVKSKVITRLPFVVLDCGGAKLKVTTKKRQRTLDAVSSGPAFTAVSFKLGTMKRVTVPAIMVGTKRYALKKRGTTLFSQNGLKVRMQKGQLIVNGLPAKTTRVRALLSTKSRFKKQRYTATLTSPSGKHITVRSAKK